MGMNIEVEINGVLLKGRIDGKRSPATAKALADSLPLSGAPMKWGDEIYMSVPFHVDDENGTEDVKLGEIGYWPPGNMLCIFFGPTPTSSDGRPKPASSVNIVGSVEEHERLKVISHPKTMSIRASD